MSAVRRASQMTPSVFNTRPSTCELVQVANSGKCSSKKSVFRSATRERVSVSRVVLRRIYTQVDFDQDRGDAAPCAGVNSMVKLLRAHGGCLGRDRR